MDQQIEKEIQILQRFYKFNYPVYSGTSIECIECGNGEWITGKEFKDNKDSYLVNIFHHKSSCSVNDQIKKSINDKDGGETSNNTTLVIDGITVSDFADDDYITF